MNAAPRSARGPALVTIRLMGPPEAVTFAAERLALVLSVAKASRDYPTGRRARTSAGIWTCWSTATTCWSRRSGAVADLRAPLDRPLVGYRAWLANRWSNPPQLLSTSWPVAWDPIGVNEARCLIEAPAPWPHARLSSWTGSLLARGARQRARHEAPASHCGCGLYAYGSLSTAMAWARGNVFEPWRPGPYNLLVLGAVLLWGEGERRVRIGDVIEVGVAPGLRYRAPHARVLALLGPERRDDTAHDIGPALGLPVLSERGLEVYAREHGMNLRLAGEEVA